MVRPPQLVPLRLPPGSARCVPPPPARTRYDIRAGDVAPQLMIVRQVVGNRRSHPSAQGPARSTIVEPRANPPMDRRATNTLGANSVACPVPQNARQTTRPPRVQARHQSDTRVRQQRLSPSADHRFHCDRCRSLGRARPPREFRSPTLALGLSSMITVSIRSQETPLCDAQIRNAPSSGVFTPKRISTRGSPAWHARGWLRRSLDRARESA